MLMKLNVVDRDGNKTAHEVEEGTTIRDAIEEKLSPDNYGVCGGNCSCGTCHIYVMPDDFKKLRAVEEDEISTLAETATKTTSYSRLGCQIELKKEYDNITVTIASD